MDFRVSERVEQCRGRIAAFVAAHILPLEAEPGSYDGHGNIRLDLLGDLRARARADDLWCLQLRPETGGQGLGKIGMAVCYAEMNRSIFVLVGLCVIVGVIGGCADRPSVPIAPEQPRPPKGYIPPNLDQMVKGARDRKH